MARSTCFYCSNPQQNPYAQSCDQCTSTFNEAREHVMQSGAPLIEAEKDPEVKSKMQRNLEAEADRVGKAARDERSFHARRNYIDPRTGRQSGELS